MPAQPTSVITQTVVDFLRTVPPFQFLPAGELTPLAGHLTLEYFPKDTVILSAGHKASDSLFIVQKGAVKLAIRTAIGKELTLDMRSEGEIFGLLSLMGRDIARLDVVAVEETICYGVPAEQMQELIAHHAEIADYLFRTSVTRYMDRILNELRQQSRLMGDGERLLYSLPVGDAASQPATVCAQSMPVQEAARLLSSANATCLFVVDPQGKALGIVTEKDFTQKVVARGLAGDRPVGSIMSAPVISVEEGEMVFQALLAMLSHDIHHVLVTADGVPKSVLTNHDLMLLQGKSPLTLVRHLEQQQTLDDLAGAQKRIGDLLPLLLREGASACHITRVMAEVNDRLTGKILELAQAELGPSPLPYCWVALGSEGRAEQTFKTDQDNALIYADAADSDAAAAERYFAALSAFVRDALVRCGYPLCEGGFMASNPLWRQPVSVWQRYFSQWMEAADRRSAEDALIFLDMRPVAGDRTLFDAVAEHTRLRLQTAGLFKSIVAMVSLDHKPPLGFFRAFVLERTGQHKKELDLKWYGTGPIVSAVRVLALDRGVAHTNTMDRLAALESGGEDTALLKDLRAALEFLMLLRLECQLRQARAGQTPGNYIRPDTLTNLQRSALKQAFHTVAQAQSLIESRFRSAEWAQLGR